MFSHGVAHILLLLMNLLFEPHHKKTYLVPYANNKDADLRSLISVFVVRYLDNLVQYLSFLYPKFHDSR